MVEIKNVVMVASIIAFVAIAALFVKCVQRQGVNGVAVQRDPAAIYREISNEPYDENMTSE